MIFGIDVNHPTNTDATTSKSAVVKDESVAAIVGSIDLNCSYYPARLMAQKQQKGASLEMIFNLSDPVFELIMEYRKNNPHLKFPQRLIFFRLGPLIC